MRGQHILHFNNTYEHTIGALRLPVLALYSVYQCMMDELQRFEGKVIEHVRENGETFGISKRKQSLFSM